MCLKTLDLWASKVRFDVERHYYRFRQNPAEFHNSEGEYCMMVLITVLQQDFGVHYHKDRDRQRGLQECQGPFHPRHDRQPERRHVRIHAGALYGGGAAVGLAGQARSRQGSRFCRWESEKERFNIEGSGQGFSRQEDGYYRKWPLPISDNEIKAGLYLKSLTPQEELASFLASRGHCLLDNGRTAEAQVAYALAHQLRRNRGSIPACWRKRHLEGEHPSTQPPRLTQQKVLPPRRQVLLARTGARPSHPVQLSREKRSKAATHHRPSLGRIRRRQGPPSCHRRIHYSPETPPGEAISQFGYLAYAGSPYPHPETEVEAFEQCLWLCELRTRLLRHYREGWRELLPAFTRKGDFQ